MMNEIDKILFIATQLQTIAKDILQEAKRHGADQAEVSIQRNKGLQFSAREGDVETVEYNQDKVD